MFYRFLWLRFLNDSLELCQNSAESPDPIPVPVAIRWCYLCRCPKPCSFGQTRPQCQARANLSHDFCRLEVTDCSLRVRTWCFCTLASLSSLLDSSRVQAGCKFPRKEKILSCVMNENDGESKLKHGRPVTRPEGSITSSTAETVHEITA